jgi:hypothetical protein
MRKSNTILKVLNVFSEPQRTQRSQRIISSITLRSDRMENQIESNNPNINCINKFSKAFKQG